MDVKIEIVSFLTGFFIFYTLILVDFIPKIDTSLFFNPFVKFFVLSMMFLASRFDMFVAVLIGFAFVMTKFTCEYSQNMHTQSSMVQQNKMDSFCDFLPPTKMNTILDKTSEQRSENTNQSTVKENKVVLPVDMDSNLSDLDNTLTTNKNLKDAQNNVVNETAMNLEIKSWSDGYGPQGLS